MHHKVLGRATYFNVCAPTRAGTHERVDSELAHPLGSYYIEVPGVVVGLDCAPRNPCPQDRTGRTCGACESRARNRNAKSAPEGALRDGREGPRQAGQGFEPKTLRKLFVLSRIAGFGFG